MSIYMIADTHFFHKNIIEYENRPFKTVEEMNEALITNWNQTISKLDVVYLLGDFCWKAKTNGKEILDRLNGYKVLVMGNHDSISHKTFLQMGFDEVSKYPIILENYFILSHEPMYININMPYANIFGHVHGNPAFKDYSRQTFCVSVERPKVNYRPLLFDKIKQLMSSCTD